MLDEGPYPSRRTAAGIRTHDGLAAQQTLNAANVFLALGDLPVEAGDVLARGGHGLALNLKPGELGLVVRDPGLQALLWEIGTRPGRKLTGGVEHRKHREDGKKVQRDRRHEPGALARNIAPRQLAGLPREHRQRAPDLAFEVEQPLDEVVEESDHRPVDMRLLAARRAIGPGQLRLAIKAALLVRVAVSFARFRLDRPAEQSAGHRIADR